MTEENSAERNGAEALTFEVPAWLREWESTLGGVLETDEAAMRLAVTAARRNVEAETGGPFGAVIVDARTRTCLAIGVNLVVSSGSSVLHAEMVAIMRAQRRVQFHQVGGPSGAPTTLYTSAEPCAMCLGAVPWSGITRVVCGATDGDVRAVGFDEGDKPQDWMAAYARRGIQVSTGVLREDAVAVLKAYRDAGGTLY